MTAAAAGLPTGTVTFLLTDIEASTELVQRLGDRWPAIAGDHRRLLRAAVDEAGGFEVDARGEEFFFAFRRAHDAVRAADAAQRALAVHAWPADAVVRVRMGLHTGEPAVGDDGGYLGLDVHRAARICAAGHGGQVLCSATTRAVVTDSDFQFADLGEQRLKGLERAERIFQLSMSDIPQTFPPLRIARAAPFEGAEQELAVAALARVRDRVRQVAPRRRHASPARRAADICFTLRARLPRVPESERAGVTELARAFVDLSRAASDADRYLTRIDRRALAKRIAETRDLAVISKNAARAADRLERQLALVDGVVEVRSELDVRIAELEHRAMSGDPAGMDGLGHDVDALADRVAATVDDAIRDVGYVAERFRRTWRPGILRQGDTWVVRHYDSLGVEHLARFDALRDARAFRKQVRLDIKDQEAAEQGVINIDHATGAGAYFAPGLQVARRISQPTSGGLALKLVAVAVVVGLLVIMILMSSRGLDYWG